MRNSIMLETVVNGKKIADVGRVVRVYEYNASDTAGSAPNGLLVATFSELGNGVYEISFTESLRATIVVDALCKAGGIGVLLNGETAMDDFIDTSALQDAAVTPVKTTFTS